MSLEKEVREIVVDNFTKRIEEAWSSREEANKTVREHVEKNTENCLDKFVLDGKLDIKQAYEVQEELLSTIKDFDYMDAYLRDIKSSWLNGEKLLTEEYEIFLEEMDNWGEPIDTDIKSIYILAWNNFLDYIKRKDRVVFCLAEKAEKEGLEAIDKEAVYSAVREEFQTAEDYIQAYKKWARAVLTAMKEEISVFVDVEEMKDRLMYCVADSYIDFFIQKDVKALYSG